MTGAARPRGERSEGGDRAAGRTPAPAPSLPWQWGAAMAPARRLGMTAAAAPSLRDDEGARAAPADAVARAVAVAAAHLLRLGAGRLEPAAGGRRRTGEAVLGVGGDRDDERCAGPGVPAGGIEHLQVDAAVPDARREVDAAAVGVAHAADTRAVDRHVEEVVHLPHSARRVAGVAHEHL